MVDRSWELAIRGLHLFGATDFLESIGVVTAGDTDQPVRFGLPPRMFGSEGKLPSEPTTGSLSCHTLHAS